MLAAEVIVFILSFQYTPPVLHPFFFFAGLPHNINKRNYCGYIILEACGAASENVTNSVLQN